MDVKSGVILQLYARAKAPSRDYFGLTIKEKEVLLNTWNISHGPHTFPKKHRCSLEELEQTQPLLDDIQRLFGKHVVNFALCLGRGVPKLECLPTRTFRHILSYLECNDILKLSQTSKILFELCNRNDIWEIIFTKRNHDAPSKDELRASDTKGWKVVLKNKIVWVEHLKKKPLTALGLRETPSRSSSLSQAKKAYESKLKVSAAAAKPSKASFLEVKSLPKPVPQFKARQRSREDSKLEPSLAQRLQEIASESVALNKSTEDLLQTDLDELQSNVAAANDLILSQIRSGERFRPTTKKPKGILKKPTKDFKVVDEPVRSKEQKQVDEISRYVDIKYGQKSSAQRNNLNNSDFFAYAHGDHKVDRNDEDVMRSNFETFLSSKSSQIGFGARPICSQMIPSISELRKSMSVQASPARNNTKIANKNKPSAQLNNKSNVISASTSALEMKRNSFVSDGKTNLKTNLVKNTNCNANYPGSSTNVNRTKSHLGLKKSANL